MTKAFMNVPFGVKYIHSVRHIPTSTTVYLRVYIFQF